MSKIRKRVNPATAALNLTVEEAATVIGFGRSSLYEMVRAGRLRAFKHGRSTRISRDEAERVARELARGSAA